MNKENNEKPDSLAEKFEDNSNQEEKNINLTKEVEILQQQRLLLLAKLENQRKQLYQDFQKERQYNNRKLIEWLIDFLADLEEKALLAMKLDREEKVRNHVKGIEMIIKNLLTKLEEEGVKKIEIEEKKTNFNSHFHEAVAEEKDHNLPDGVILEVVTKGYSLHNLVIKPAKVKVNKIA